MALSITPRHPDSMITAQLPHEGFETVKAHWKYLCYVVRHKWFVLLAGLSLRVPLWQLIVHDWSKFLPSEWFPYVDYFYGGPWVSANYGDQRLHIGERFTQPWVDRRFNDAWNRHQKRQPHHWQFWLLTMDNGETVPLEMPEKYVLEMVATKTYTTSRGSLTPLLMRRMTIRRIESPEPVTRRSYQ